MQSVLPRAGPSAILRPEMPSPAGPDAPRPFPPSISLPAGPLARIGFPRDPGKVHDGSTGANALARIAASGARRLTPLFRGPGRPDPFDPDGERVGRLAVLMSRIARAHRRFRDVARSDGIGAAAARATRKVGRKFGSLGRRLAARLGPDRCPYFTPPPRLGRL